MTDKTAGLRRYREEQKRKGEENRRQYQQRCEKALERVHRLAPELPLFISLHMGGFTMSLEELETWLDEQEER